MRPPAAQMKVIAAIGNNAQDREKKTECIYEEAQDWLNLPYLVEIVFWRQKHPTTFTCLPASRFTGKIKIENGRRAAEQWREYWAK